jgi:hypothetical protein
VIHLTQKKGQRRQCPLSAKASCRAYPKETDMTDLTAMKDAILTSDELDRVAGGIIIVSGIQRQFISALERVALNPQPLPPRIFSFRHG